MEECCVRKATGRGRIREAPEEGEFGRRTTGGTGGGRRGHREREGTSEELQTSNSAMGCSWILKVSKLASTSVPSARLQALSPAGMAMKRSIAKRGSWAMYRAIHRGRVRLQHMTIMNVTMKMITEAGRGTREEGRGRRGALGSPQLLKELVVVELRWLTLCVKLAAPIRFNVSYARLGPALLDILGTRRLQCSARSFKLEGLPLLPGHRICGTMRGIEEKGWASMRNE